MRKTLLLISMLLSLSAYSQQRGEGVFSSVQQKESADPYKGMTIADRMTKAADYMQQDKWQLAKDIYDNVLSLEPGNLTALYYRAYANERLFHFGLARADYDAVLKAEPTNFHALTARALFNEKDSHHTEALDDANLLVEQYPDSVLSWVVRADIEERQNLLPLAEYDYLQAYELEPSNKEYLLQAVDLQLKQKKKKEAKRNLDKLVSAGMPKQALIHYYKRINLRNP